jgi:hypothetical protein
MMQLENLKPGISLVGIEPTLIATVLAVVPIADGAVQVLYKIPEGTIKDRLLGRADEANISLATMNSCPCRISTSSSPYRGRSPT